MHIPFYYIYYENRAQGTAD